MERWSRWSLGAPVLASRIIIAIALDRLEGQLVFPARRRKYVNDLSYHVSFVIL